MGEKKTKRGKIRNMEIHTWEVDTEKTDVDT